MSFYLKLAKFRSLKESQLESSGGGGETREGLVSRLAKDMLSKLPPNYDPFEVQERLRQMGHLNSMNIFLRQEIDRIQKVCHQMSTKDSP